MNTISIHGLCRHPLRGFVRAQNVQRLDFAERDLFDLKSFRRGDSVLSPIANRLPSHLEMRRDPRSGTAEMFNEFFGVRVHNLNHVRFSLTCQVISDNITPLVGIPSKT